MAISTNPFTKLHARAAARTVNTTDLRLIGPQ